MSKSGQARDANARLIAAAPVCQYNPSHTLSADRTWWSYYYCDECGEQYVNPSKHEAECEETEQ